MTSHVQLMVDLETKSKYDNAIITRLAITPFRFEEDANTTFEELVDRTFYIALDQDEQERMGRVASPDTIEWWESQKEELKIESYYPTSNDLSIEDAFNKIKDFLKKSEYNHYKSFLWARNCGFECFKLQSLEEMFFGAANKYTFNNWNWHECKTFNYIFTAGATEKYTVETETPFQYHNAKHDAAMDTYRMIQLWNETPESLKLPDWIKEAETSINQIKELVPYTTENDKLFKMMIKKLKSFNA